MSTEHKSMNQATPSYFLHIHLMQTFLFLRWVVPASKWFKKVPMRMMSLLLRGRGRWALVLKVPVGVAALIHQLRLVAPLAKVIVLAPTKRTNRMIIMMTKKTSPWTRSRHLSLGPQNLLVWQLQGVSSRRCTTQGGLTMCTRRGTPIPLFGKSNLMRTSGFGSSSMRIGMSL
jgi:hypothetical protein